MKAQWLLVAASLLTSGAALSQVSACDTECQKSHRYCISSGKGSERSCLAALEKCRKACLKKMKSGSTE